MARLTKYEKETIILFNEGEDKASIYTYVLDKSRLSIRLQPPMSEERRRKASEYAKQNGFNAKADND